MEKRTNALARILAALALVGAVLVVVIVIASGTGEDSSSSDHSRSTRTAKQRPQPDKPPPATYTVQSGDTLTSIAHQTGVPVAEILALNPEVDPQILIAGQTLKLR